MNAWLYLLIPFVLIAVLIYFAFPNFKKTKKKFPTKSSDLFWNVVFEWKWRPTSNGFEIEPESVKKFCPNCHADLTPKMQGAYYFLFCDACKFISQEYHHQVNGEPDWSGKILVDRLQEAALKE